MVRHLPPPPVIAVISAALFFSTNVAFGIIHKRVVGVIFGLAGHHGRDIGFIVFISVDQIKVVKNTTAAGGGQIVLPQLQCDLIIKARFFTDIGGRNVLQGLRYLKAVLGNGVKSRVSRIGIKNIKIAE